MFKNLKKEVCCHIYFIVTHKKNFPKKCFWYIAVYVVHTQRMN